MSILQSTELGQFGANSLIELVNLGMYVLKAFPAEKSSMYPITTATLCERLHEKLLRA